MRPSFGRRYGRGLRTGVAALASIVARGSVVTDTTLTGGDRAIYQRDQAPRFPPLLIVAIVIIAVVVISSMASPGGPPGAGRRGRRRRGADLFFGGPGWGGGFGGSGGGFGGLFGWW
jgi:hypothetical protein